jgi:hypothetical protein
MTCTAPNRWEATVESPDPIEFKLTKNRKHWEVAPNHTAYPNNTVHISPEFPPESYTRRYQIPCQTPSNSQDTSTNELLQDILLIETLEDLNN